jgi:HK97 family phage prohead protease
VSKPFGVVKEGDNELMGCHATEGDAHDQVEALYAKEPMMANSANEKVRAPIELRSAVVDGVDHEQRIITILAVPYEQPGPVMFRDEVWQEVFTRGAFDGLASMPNRIKANRDHDKTRPVGKAINFWPDDPKGLLAEVKISNTPLGSETLQLAKDGVLDISVGYAAPADREHTLFNRRIMERRILKAYLDHISFVTDPAFVDAQVVAVRANDVVSAPAPTRSAFPNLDRAIKSDVLANVSKYLAEHKRGE